MKFCEACMKCPKGTYMPITEATACTQCPGVWVDGPGDGWRIFLTNQSLNPKKLTHIYIWCTRKWIFLHGLKWDLWIWSFWTGFLWHQSSKGWDWKSNPPCSWMVSPGVAWAKWRKRVAHKHKAIAAVQKARWCVIQRFDALAMGAHLDWNKIIQNACQIMNVSVSVFSDSIFYSLFFWALHPEIAGPKKW